MLVSVNVATDTANNWEWKIEWVYIVCFFFLAGLVSLLFVVISMFWRERKKTTITVPANINQPLRAWDQSITDLHTRSTYRDTYPCAKWHYRYPDIIRLLIGQPLKNYFGLLRPVAPANYQPGTFVMECHSYCLVWSTKS